jgi:hypothetical protein
MKSYFKQPVRVEKRKLDPSNRKKNPNNTETTDKPVYTTMEKQLHKHTKRESQHFPRSWWLPGEK